MTDGGRKKNQKAKGVQRKSQKGERESMLDRQCTFEREEVTEEKMQTKEEEG